MHAAIGYTFFQSLNYVFCQEWITATNRKVYVQNGEELSLSWKADFQGQELLFATIGVQDENNEFDPALIVYDRNTSNPKVFDKSRVKENPSFGEITFLSINQSFDKVAAVKFEFVDTIKELRDTIDIVYVEGPPEYLRHLFPPQKTFTENSQDSINQHFKVQVIGKPLTPLLIWTINGVSIVDKYDDVTVIRKKLKQENAYEEILIISKMIPSFDGVLNVVAKYGNFSDESIHANSTMQIKMLYSPKEVTITSNAPNNVFTGKGFLYVQCEAKSSPPPMYHIYENGHLRTINKDGQLKYEVGTYVLSDKLMFSCYANNSLNGTLSDYLYITISNGTLVGRRAGEEKVHWRVYFFASVGIGIVVFLGSALTLYIIRSRTRSMKIWHKGSRLRTKVAASSRDDYARQIIQRSGMNRAYDLNQRGRPDGTLSGHTRRESDLHGLQNNVYDLYE